jgi:hypothetical protein
MLAIFGGQSFGLLCQNRLRANLDLLMVSILVLRDAEGETSTKSGIIKTPLDFTLSAMHVPGYNESLSRTDCRGRSSLRLCMAFLAGSFLAPQCKTQDKHCRPPICRPRTSLRYRAPWFDVIDTSVGGRLDIREFSRCKGNSAKMYKVLDRLSP